jgi:methyl coenzyme M reductase gamma subunit
MEESTERIQWHSGFYGAAELELREDKDILEFIQEIHCFRHSLLSHES